jgi:capsular exopolysaccharide synthesis family protein
MELIEKALAKARAEAPKTPPAGPVPPPIADERAGAAVAVNSGVDNARTSLEGISYSRTRVSPASSSAWPENRLVAHLNDRTSDLFRILRTKVLQQMRDNNWRTLAVVGATAGVGKSTIAANLSLSIALDSNQTVLLVDADLRKPRLATYFGVTSDKGLGDYLDGKVELPDVLLNPGVERLVLLPSVGSYANSTEMLGSRKMSELVTELKARYETRLLICDLPPLLASGDALGFLPQFDCALLVVQNGGNTAAELTETRRLLAKTNLLGWILNKAEPGLSGGYYQHYYGDKR